MDPMNYTLLALLLLLQYGDIWTTYRLLEKGGRELNPVVAWPIRRFGILRGLLVVKLPLCAALIVTTFVGLMPAWVLTGLCALYVIVVTHNLLQLERVR